MLTRCKSKLKQGSFGNLTILKIVSTEMKEKEHIFSKQVLKDFLSQKLHKKIQEIFHPPHILGPHYYILSVWKNVINFGFWLLHIVLAKEKRKITNF